jgi:hypothetical protein
MMKKKKGTDLGENTKPPQMGETMLPSNRPLDADR